MDYRDIFEKYFPVWGICPFSEAQPYLFECAAKKRIPENADSIIVALFPYSLEDEKYENANISRYAVVPDYHVVAKERLSNACDELRQLYPDEEFEVFIDNSPLPEVSVAVKAGVGTKGKNGLLINPDYGSWVFIGEIVTTMKINISSENRRECIGCMKCVEACPTGALSENGFDREICLSAITQQKKPLTEEQKELIKKSGCIWGCDICQKVCPMNKNKSTTDIEEFINGAEMSARTHGNLEGRAYMWRGKEVIERNMKLIDE